MPKTQRHDKNGAGCAPVHIQVKLVEHQCAEHQPRLRSNGRLIFHNGKLYQQLMWEVNFICPKRGKKTKNTVLFSKEQAWTTESSYDWTILRPVLVSDIEIAKGGQQVARTCKRPEFCLRCSITGNAWWKGTEKATTKKVKNLDPIHHVQDLLGNFTDYPTWICIDAQKRGHDQSNTQELSMVVLLARWGLHNNSLTSRSFLEDSPH